jgi:membrane protein implicated in regulation of membrane protease activity
MGSAAFALSIMVMLAALLDWPPAIQSALVLLMIVASVTVVPPRLRRRRR